MAHDTIRLSYRKIIHGGSMTPWEQRVFESSYQEFRLQVQNYDPGRKFPRFADLIREIPAADKLHFLVSAAVMDYLRQLDGKIPDILNNLGQTFLRFHNYRFELIDSDISDKLQHRVAIWLFSDPLIWHETVGNFLLVSPADTEPSADGRLTELVQLQPYLSIHSLKTEPK